MTNATDREHALLKRCLLPVVVALTMLTALAPPSAAQDSSGSRQSNSALPVYRSRILGVFDAESGQPVMDANVIGLLTGTSAKTTRTGTVVLSFLPDGGGLVRIQKLGYAAQTMVVAISPADTAPVTVVLQPAVVLPGVTVQAAPHYISPNLRGFEERRRIGMGYYIDEATLRKDESWTLGDVLRTHAPGVNIRDAGASAQLLERSPRCMVGGPPAVYLDGMRIRAFPPLTAHLFAQLRKGKAPPTTGAVDLSQFEVWDLAGVEYYPDQNVAPMQFSGTSDACGVLLLWTREQ